MRRCRRTFREGLHARVTGANEPVAGGSNVTSTDAESCIPSSSAPPGGFLGASYHANKRAD